MLGRVQGTRRAETLDGDFPAEPVVAARANGWAKCWTQVPWTRFYFVKSMRYKRWSVEAGSPAASALTNRREFIA